MCFFLLVAEVGEEIGAYLSNIARESYICAEESVLSIPRSMALVANDSKSSTRSENQSVTLDAIAEGKDDDAPVKKSSKPKWFKL